MVVVVVNNNNYRYDRPDSHLFFPHGPAGPAVVRVWNGLCRGVVIANGGPHALEGHAETWRTLHDIVVEIYTVRLRSSSGGTEAVFRVNDHSRRTRRGGPATTFSAPYGFLLGTDDLGARGSAEVSVTVVYRRSCFTFISRFVYHKVMEHYLPDFNRCTEYTPIRASRVVLFTVFI